MSPHTLENVHFSKNYVEILCAAALRPRGTPVPCLSPIHPLEPFEKRSDLVGALGGYGGRDP